MKVTDVKTCKDATEFTSFIHTNEPDRSWLSGKYEVTGSDGKPAIIEIDTALSFIGIGDEFFAQGEDADAIIGEIHGIWLRSDRTQDEAVKIYADSMGIEIYGH